MALTVSEEWAVSAAITLLTVRRGAGEVYGVETHSGGSDFTEYAVSDGTQGWTDTKGDYGDRIVADGDTLYYASTRGDLLKIDATDGSTRQSETGSEYAEVQLADGDLYVGDDDTRDLFKYAGGDLTSRSVFANSAYVGGLAYDPTTGYLLHTDTFSGDMTALSLDGTVQWSSADAYPANAGQKSMVASDGSFYVYDGAIERRSASDGSLEASVTPSPDFGNTHDAMVLGPGNDIWLAGDSVNSKGLLVRATPDLSTVETAEPTSENVTNIAVTAEDAEMKALVSTGSTLRKYATGVDAPVPISGTVTDPNGNAIAGAAIRVIDEDADAVEATTTTDSNGDYSVNVPMSPPTYHVVAIVDGEQRTVETFPFVEANAP